MITKILSLAHMLIDLDSAAAERILYLEGFSEAEAASIVAMHRGARSNKVKGYIKDIATSIISTMLDGATMNESYLYAMRVNSLARKVINHAERRLS